VIFRNFLRHKFTTIFVASLLSIGCTQEPSDSDGYAFLASLPYDQGRGQSQNNLIDVGDTLQLFVKEDAQFNATYEVRERGDIIIPVIGRIPVKGLSIASAESRVKSYLEKDQLKSATVILDRVQDKASGPIADTHRILVYMTGEVPKPGQHILAVPNGRTLGIYEAILISGGLSRYADEQKIHVIRVDKKGVRNRVPIDIRPIRKGEKPDLPIAAGDVIVVPEKVFGF
jgi:protein involved in polysaccharide export with SLBB domain